MEGVVLALLVAVVEAADGGVDAAGGVCEDREREHANQRVVLIGTFDLLGGTDGDQERDG